MAMIEFEDRGDAESRDALLRIVNGLDPLPCARRNRMLWFWVLVSITLNVAQAGAILALVFRR